MGSVSMGWQQHFEKMRASSSQRQEERRCGSCDTMIVGEHEEDEDGYLYCDEQCLVWMENELAIERWHGEY